MGTCRCVGFSAYNTWRHLNLLLLLLQLPAMACAWGRNATFGAQKVVRDGSDSSWDWISSLPHFNGTQFTRAAQPLLLMCTNAYNFQYHVDPRKQPHLIPIKGWSLSLKVPPAAPLHAGAAGIRALVYVEELVDPSAPPGVVVAFRGWQTSSTSLHELADLCAGKLLFPHYIDFLTPPSHLCSSLFNESSLDYLSQAITYTHLVLQSYPPSSVLLTGHSFGGGLALLVSAALQHKHHGDASNKVGGLRSIFQSPFTSHQPTTKLSHSGVRLPVLSFSSPGTHHLLSHRRWWLHHMVTISHKWDFFSLRAHWKGHDGWLCLYEKEEPASCKACFSDKQHFSCQDGLKPNASMDDPCKAKEKNDDNNNNNDDEDDNNEDDKDCDDDENDDDDDTCENYDSDDDDDDDDDDECEYHDEPCWDCLSDTHAPHSLLALMEEGMRPKCTFSGSACRSAATRKAGCFHGHSQVKACTLRNKYIV